MEERCRPYWGSTSEKKTDNLETAAGRGGAHSANLSKSPAARLTQMGADENALWLTVNESPQCTPMDNARDFKVILQGFQKGCFLE